MADEGQDVFLYEVFRAEFLIKPFFAGPYGYGWQQTMGAAWDAEIVNLKAAAKVDMPMEAPADALDWIGLERGLERITPTLNQGGESEQVYRTRLQQAWTEWSISGTVDGHRQWASWMNLAAKVYRQHEWGPGADYHGEWVNGREVTLRITGGATAGSTQLNTFSVPPWGSNAPAQFELHEALPPGRGPLNVVDGFAKPARAGRAQLRLGLGAAGGVTYTLAYKDEVGVVRIETLWAAGPGTLYTAGFVGEMLSLASDKEPAGTVELGLAPGLPRTAKLTLTGGPNPSEVVYVKTAVAAGDTLVDVESAGPGGGLQNGGFTHATYHTGWIHLWPTFWVVINQPHPWFVPKIGQVAPFPLIIGDGKWVIGSSATPAEVARLARLARTFKSGHSTPIEIILAPVGGWIIAPDAGPIGAMGLVIGGQGATRLLVGEKWWSLVENGVETRNV